MSGIEFLSAFKGPWDFVIVIGAAVVGSLIVIWASRQTKGKVGFSLFHGFTVEHPKEPLLEVKPKATPSWRDVAYILHKGEDIWHKINYIDLFATVRAQMNYAEERLLDSLSTVEKSFVELLRTRIGNMEAHILDLPIFRHYQVIINLTNEMILLPKFRALFRENRLAERTEEEFQVYLRNKSSYLLDSAIHYVDSLWVADPNLNITRDDVRAWFDVNVYPVLLEVYEDIMRNGRRISIAMKEEKASLLADFDAEVKERFPDTDA